MNELDDLSEAALRTPGDLDVRDGARVRESIHAEGRITIGANATVEGSASAIGGATLGDGASIQGTLRVVGATLWGEGAQAARVAMRGPLFTRGGARRADSVLAARGIRPEQTQGGTA